MSGSSLELPSRGLDLPLFETRRLRHETAGRGAGRLDRVRRSGGATDLPRGVSDAQWRVAPGHPVWQRGPLLMIRLQAPLRPAM